MSRPRILVTGANGFLGSAVVRQALKAGFLVTATDLSINPIGLGFDYYSSNILEPTSLLRIFNGVEAVCHIAGLAHIFRKSESLSAPFHAVNVIGSQNVMNAAILAGIKNFIFVSSVSVYGGEAYGKDELSECHAENPYSRSKLDAERSLIELSNLNKINLTIFRLATLYGEEDPGNVGRLIRSLDGRRFIWIGKGENLKSLIHRDDAARAFIAVLSRPAAGINIYNVSAPPEKMFDIVDAIARALGRPVPEGNIPAKLAINLAKIIKNLPSRHGRLGSLHDTLQKWLSNDYYSANKFCDTFGYQTEISLEEGISREVAWYRGNK